MWLASGSNWHSACEATARRFKHSHTEWKLQLPVVSLENSVCFNIYLVLCWSIPLVEVSKCDADPQDDDNCHHEDSEDVAWQRKAQVGRDKNMKCMWTHWGSSMPVVPRSFFFLGPVCTRWLTPITGCTAAASPPWEAELAGRRLWVEEGSPAESRDLASAGTSDASSEDINNNCQLWSKWTVINKAKNLWHYGNKTASLVGFWTGAAVSLSSRAGALYVNKCCWWCVLLQKLVLSTKLLQELPPQVRTYICALFI